MYNTGTELKLLQQYSSFLLDYDIKDKYDDVADRRKVDESEYLIDHSKELSVWKFESTCILLSQSGKIYYVMSNDGTCIIKEINPRND